MKVLPVVFLCFFLFISGLSQEIFPQLIGGRQTSIATYPYLAGIFTNNFFTCGGAIINFRSVLTVRKNVIKKVQVIRKKNWNFSRQHIAYCQHHQI